MSPFPNIVSPLPEINSENGAIAGGEKIVARKERVEKKEEITKENEGMVGKAWEHALPLLLQSWIRSPTPLSFLLQSSTSSSDATN